MCGSVPSAIIASVHRGDGWTAWKRLAAEFEVHGAAGRLADLSRLLHPRWDEVDFLRCWHEWEKELSKIEIKHGQALSSDVKCAIVAHSLPPGVRQLLRCMPSDFLEDYNRLRKIVKEMYDRGRAFGLDARRPWMGPAPMEIDAMKTQQQQPFRRQYGATYGAFGRKWEPQPIQQPRPQQQQSAVFKPCCRDR